MAGTKIDEAFIGSCMTNIGHFRAAAKLLGGSRDIPVKLWVAPPTKMDESELIKEGHYVNFGAAGARTEMPGCSLCMGNQAQHSPAEEKSAKNRVFAHYPCRLNDRFQDTSAAFAILGLQELRGGFGCCRLGLIQNGGLITLAQVPLISLTLRPSFRLRDCTKLPVFRSKTNSSPVIMTPNRWNMAGR